MGEILWPNVIRMHTVLNLCHKSKRPKNVPRTQLNVVSVLHYNVRSIKNKIYRAPDGNLGTFLPAMDNMFNQGPILLVGDFNVILDR